MIPTRLRRKLPRTLSFPVSARDASEALAASPVCSEFSLVFWDGAVWPASAFRRILSEKAPYRILAAEYHPELASHEPTRWKLTVYPVPRELRHAVRNLILGEGLPSIFRWTNSYADEGWRRRYHRMEVILDPVAPCLSVEGFDGVA
jgi:hypothetical protein